MIDPVSQVGLIARAAELGVPLSASQLPIRRLWAARRHEVGSGPAVPPAGPMAVGETRAAVIEATHPLAVARVWLHTFGSTTAEARLSLVRIDRDRETEVAAEHLRPPIDQVWYELQPTLAPAGRYEVRVTVLGGTAAPAPAVDADPVTPAWTAELVELAEVAIDGGAGALVLSCEAGTELGLEVPWQRDGYSVSAEDGVGFDTIISSGGRYIPSQELKRLSAWPFSVGDAEVSFLAGDTGFTLAGPGLTVAGRMAADTMTLTVTAQGPVELRAAPARESLTAGLPRFECSDNRFAERLTRFYRERALSWPFQDYTASAVGWRHWMTRVLSWTGTQGSPAQAADLASTPQDAEGWLWTRTDCPGWPFPDPQRYDTRHPSASLSFVTGVATHYAWTGDRGFLTTQLPRARRALEHILTTYQVAQHHLLVNSIADQDGRAGSLGSHYWDIVPGGHKDAYANVLLYVSLVQHARLERHVGEPSRADELTVLAEAVRDRFQRVFWNDAGGWFVQNIDVDGVVHDYGASYLNLEAVAAGLGSPDQVRRILDWLDHGTSEVTDRVLLAAPAGGILRLPPGEPVSQEFDCTGEFSAVAALVTATDPSVGFLLSVSGPDGRDLAQRRFERWWDRGWASVDLGPYPPGRYRLTLQAEAEGLGWQRSAAADPGPGSPGLAMAAVGPFRPGAADIYSAWGFAPRATTRRNDFWYTFGWSGVEADFGSQVQDGGTSLYISGFDIEARARVSPDLAWKRLAAILDRVEAPDRLCGGIPLYHGEIPQAMLPGQVGVDNPFPESGLVPTAVLPAFLGLDPTPDGLVVRPNLPSALSHLAVANLHWHGHRLTIGVDRTTVTVSSDTEHLSAAVQDGSAVVLTDSSTGTLQLHPCSTTKGQR